MRDYIWERRTLINRRGKVIKPLFCQHPASPETPQWDRPGGKNNNISEVLD
jgi:hypothetical protein